MIERDLFIKYQNSTVPIVDQAMMEYCQTLLPGEYHGQKEIIEYHFNWGNQIEERSQKGKRLRPLMLLLAAESVGGRQGDALPAAAAVEFIHNFSLIHDDIEDHDEFRHGKESVWMKYGVEKAINAGDALFSLAFMSLAKLEGTECNVLELLGILSETCAKLTGGQDMDLDFENGVEISLEDYLLMVKGKTASLFEACCSMGSLLGGGSPDEQISLSRFGRNLGLAFQIRDDWLGLWGDPEKTGKNRANDLLTAKWTFPILYTAQVDSNLVETIRANRAKLNPQELIQKIANTGASEYTIQFMNKLLDEANSELDQLKNGSEATAILRSLIENVRNL